MTPHALGKLAVPHMGGSHIYGIRRKLKREPFGINTLARTLTAGYQDYLSHFTKGFMSFG